MAKATPKPTRKTQAKAAPKGKGRAVPQAKHQARGAASSAKRPMPAPAKQRVKAAAKAPVKAAKPAARPAAKEAAKPGKPAGAAAKAAPRPAGNAPVGAAKKPPARTAPERPAPQPRGAPTVTDRKGAGNGEQATAESLLGIRSRMPHIDDATLSKIVAKLTEMRDESQNVVNMHMHQDLEERDKAGDVGDDLDQAVTERDREFNLIMHQRHLRRLQQVQDALQRIQDGTYGYCEGTDEPINPKRLLIMPLARYSLEYQEQQEKMLGRSPEDTLGAGEESFAAEE